MMWKTEYDNVLKTFTKLGEKHQKYMYQCYIERKFPRLVWKEIAANGLFDIMVKHSDSHSLRFLSAAYQGFAYGSGDLAFGIAPICHGAMAVPTIHNHASQMAKDKYLPRALAGDSIVSFAVTEAQSGGTDAYFHDCLLSSNSVKKVLNGKKWHITSAPYADLFVVWARDDYGMMVAVLVESDWEGVTVGNKINCAGARTSPVGTVEFNNVVIPPENIIRFKSSRRVLSNTLIKERVIGTFAGIGLINRMIEKCLQFVKSRKVGNQKLDQQQYMQHRITNMQSRLTQLEALSHGTLSLLCDGINVDLESSVLKPFAAEAVFQCAKDAGQICASYGLQEEAQFYSALLDSWCAMVGGGTEEAHRIIVWNRMKRRYPLDGTLVIDENIQNIWNESEEVIRDIKSAM